MFDCMTQAELEAHLEISRYGTFELTDAIRPAPNLTPTEGYRHDTYLDTESGNAIPVLLAAASREKLFGLFLDLTEQMSDTVAVRLHSSHYPVALCNADNSYRESMDRTVLQSTILDFEDLLLNDGSMGMSVLHDSLCEEIQFDEHKLLIIFSNRQRLFEDVLKQHHIPCNQDIQLVIDAKHIHSSTDAFAEQFAQLLTRLGLDGFDSDSDNLHEDSIA
ncbi:MAG: hypothetical protein KC680_01110 [Candidatus Peregrinibacteria bacterium]|nr:hypothetical protein [Candidatus Peregrinibacteria bacterium]MCB9807914.1 hypothetical protein [Candidatus Peribacteria bacterium]